MGTEKEEAHAPLSQSNPIKGIIKGVEVNDFDQPITETEFPTAIRQLKNGKAVGEDGIPNEFLKNGGKEN